MMKNILFIFTLMFVLIVLANLYTSDIKIPKESIRIRIIANSNNIKDQEVKNSIREEIEKLLYSKLDNVDNIEVADRVIKESIDEVNQIVNKFNIKYHINYGKNYFPAKIYKGINYKEGIYNSLVITLENGLGNNWWCILYPPLCKLDKENVNDIEYSTLTREILKNY